jgi:hypothetical protein
MSDYDVENRPPGDEGKPPRQSLGRRSLDEIMADYRRILSPTASVNIQQTNVSGLKIFPSINVTFSRWVGLKKMKPGTGRSSCNNIDVQFGIGAGLPGHRLQM